MKDYYNILGVEKTATETEIKNAYRRLAKKYHPDVSKEEEATQKFQELQEAYSILKDPQKKAQYDMGASAANGERVHQYYYSQGGHDPFSNIHDLFEVLRGHARQPRKTVYSVKLTLEEAFTGTTRTAGGTTFRIPPGVRTGNRLSVGDFLVDILIHHHNKYKRAGDDLLLQVEITAIEAMLGTKLIINHIDGTQLSCSVPEGTQNGQILRLRQKGMPNPEIQNLRGDLLVQLAVSVPNNLTDEQKQAIMLIDHRKEINL